MAPMQLGLNPQIDRPWTEVQRSNAFWTVEFVGTQRQEVRADGSHGAGNLAGRLRGIGVKQGSRSMRDVGELPKGLNDSDLVVCMHHAHQKRPREVKPVQSETTRAAGAAVICSRPTGGRPDARLGSTSLE